MKLSTVEELETELSDPPDYVVERLAGLDGDLIVLGVAGKMGPTLARMASRADEKAGVKRRVIGVSRFSNPTVQAKLQAWGIETIQADLLDEQAVANLPDVPNVVYMAGMKFGATGNESLTWAMNTGLPANVCRRYAGSRIAAFSTGNVYGMTPVTGGGSVETDRLNPIGEYAMSCLGRERVFEHFTRQRSIPTAIIRLNYACELRYGVLVDLAQQVWSGRPINLAMGTFNVIWQGDANAMALACLTECNSPATVLNVTGPETLSVRRVCEQLAERMGKPVEFVGEESSSALLSNAQPAHQRFGYPRVAAGIIVDRVADWVKCGGETLGKPTKFEVLDGRY